MSHSIGFLDTNIVVPVALRMDNEKYKDHYYMIEVHSDFPQLGITVSFGTPTNLTPEKNLPGYKTKAITQTEYKPVVAVTFDKNFMPSLEQHHLKSETVGKGGKIAHYNEAGERIETVVQNHLHCINTVVLPKAVQKLLDPQCLGARFSSWLLVGIEILARMKNDSQVSGSDKDIQLKEGLAPLSQDELLRLTLDTYTKLSDHKAYVSDSHKKIATRIQSLPGYSESKAIEASVSPVVDKDATQVAVAMAEKPKNK